MAREVSCHRPVRIQNAPAVGEPLQAAFVKDNETIGFGALMSLPRIRARWPEWRESCTHGAASLVGMCLSQRKERTYRLEQRSQARPRACGRCAAEIEVVLLHVLAVISLALDKLEQTFL
jgi:hypothetical protein